MPTPPVQQVPGLRKAAIVIMGLGDEHASEIFKFLQEDEIERIAKEVASISHVPPEMGEIFHQRLAGVLATRGPGVRSAIAR